MINICCLRYEEGEKLIVIWCCLVDVMYDFLLNVYWVELEELVSDFLLEVLLWVVVIDQDELVGFMLFIGEYMDVLFVDLDVCGQGIGKRLVEYVLILVLGLIINVNE